MDNTSNNSSPGSRSSKWFSRRLAGNQSFGSTNDERRQSYINLNSDNFGNGTNRFQYDRNPQQNYQHRFNRSFQSDFNDQTNQHFTSDANTAFKRLVGMIAQNNANNNLIAQQQFLMQLLNKNQQSDILRRMLMKNTVDNVAAPVHVQPQQSTQQPRIPSQLELQYHTQKIMQNALLRKKMQDQCKMLNEQTSQIAAVVNCSEPNAAVQQFVQSVCPDMQRSLSVLSQTATSANHCTSFNQMYSGGNKYSNPYFVGKPNQQELSSIPQRLYQQRRTLMRNS